MNLVDSFAANHAEFVPPVSATLRRAHWLRPTMVTACHAALRALRWHGLPKDKEGLVLGPTILDLACLGTMGLGHLGAHMNSSFAYFQMDFL
jgi:hypothetical protein